MEQIIEMGTISARGQIAIPADIRKEMDLKEGEKVIFLLEDDTLIIRKASKISFAELTKPLREAKKKIKEEDVVDLIHRLRKEKNKNSP